MTLDSEEQRQIILHLINTSNFPGTFLEKILELKNTVSTANIAGEKKI